MKLSKQEENERKARALAYEAQMKEAAVQQKSAARLAFQQKSASEKAWIYFWRGLGIILGLVFIIALLWGTLG